MKLKAILEQTASALLVEPAAWSTAWARVEAASARHQG